MPRKRRTQSGEAAQPIDPGEGQGYGQAKEQAEMQQALPAPATHGAMMAPVAQPLPGQVPPGSGPPQPGPDLAALLGQAPIGLLGASQRPNQPVTAGLDSGPGPGSEILGGMRPTSPLSRTLRLLSERTGDPIFQQMADRSGL